MQQQLPRIAFAHGGHPDPRKTILHQQLQQQLRITAVALHAQLYRDSGAEAVMKSTEAAGFFLRAPRFRQINDARWPRSGGTVAASLTTQIDEIKQITTSPFRLPLPITFIDLPQSTHL